MSKTITYLPPDDNEWDQLAFQVCDHLGGEYDRPDIKHGLAGFLKIAAQAYVHHLNVSQTAAGVLDNEDE